MKPLPDNLRQLMDTLALDKNAPPSAARHMEEAIGSSPVLLHFMSRAVAQDLVDRIRFSSTDSSSGGHFDDKDKTIYINEREFLEHGSHRDYTSTEQLYDHVVSTLGHETSHAFTAEVLRTAANTLDYRIIETVREAGQRGHADLTEPVKSFLDVARVLEAEAERVGWNVLSSRIAERNDGKAHFEHLLERAVRTTNCAVKEPGKLPELAAGIRLDAEGNIPYTLVQSEAVARCHFDQSAASLGEGGNANYRNYYAAHAIERIEASTRNWTNPPEIRLDIERLGLDRDQITGAGLDFGKAGRSVSILDPATGLVTLSHNKNSSARATPDSFTTDQRANPEGTAVAGSRFSDPTHRDHVLYGAVKQAVQTRLPDGAEISEDRLAQFTLAAKAAHFKPGGRIEALVGETGISFHGDYPAHSARVDLAGPVPSADESARKSAEIDREQARQSEQQASRPPLEQEHAPVMEH